MSKIKTCLKRINKPNKKFYRNNESQMITLMGVVLVVSIVTLTAFTSDLANINALIPIERSSSILKEFLNVKEDFERAFSYNIANVSIQDAYLESQGISYAIINLVANYTDYPSEIYRAFNDTLDSFCLLELNHGIIFNAELLDFWYVSYSAQGPVYEVKVNISLDDGNTQIYEDVVYRLVCISQDLVSDYIYSGEVIDVEINTTGHYNYSIYTGSHADVYKLRQTFLIDNISTLTRIKIYMNLSGDPKDVVTLKLYRNDASPANLLDTVNVSAKNVSTDMGWIDFNIDDVVKVSSGDRFIFELSTIARKPTDCYVVAYVRGQYPPPGVMSYYDGVSRSWYPHPSGIGDSDICFRTYGLE